jgi:hypothetical protein
MTTTNALPRAESVDVMLLLEGTFPYVSGGVSSWVNQIVRGFPEYRFGAVFLGSRPDDYGDMRYTLPDNFVHLEVHHVQDVREPPAAASHRGDAKAFELNAPTASRCPSARSSTASARGSSSPTSTGASAPIPRSSTTSGRCGSCTRRSGCSPASRAR